MEGIHRLLAYAALVTTAVGLVWSLLLVGRQRRDVRAFERFQAAVVSLIIVGAASGTVLLVAGGRPAEPLHLIYAAIAVVVIPFARSFSGRTGDRREVVVLLGAFLVLGALLYRLFTTG